MDLDGMKYVFTRLFALFLMILGYHAFLFKNITILSLYARYLSDCFSLFTVALHKNVTDTYAVVSGSVSDLSHTLPVLMR